MSSAEGRFVPGPLIHKILSEIKCSGGWDDLDELKQAWRAEFPNDVMWCGQTPVKRGDAWRRCAMPTEHAGPCKTEEEIGASGGSK